SGAWPISSGSFPARIWRSSAQSRTPGTRWRSWKPPMNRAQDPPPRLQGNPERMEQTTYFEEYEIGATRITTGRTITETDFVIHAGHTGDFFPHHMDAEFMKSTPFGQRIAHGTLVFSIGIGLTANVINPVAFSYGYDRLRFVRPVFIGDTIRTKTTIIAKEDDPKRS